MKVYSFTPISDAHSKVLVLGTMPGVASLEMNQYYGHPRNAFWKLMFAVFEQPFSNDYEVRKQLALQNHIAIWDVLQACVREGSLDSAIEQEVPNDFKSFLGAHPNLELIAFNGQKAAKFFKQYVILNKPIRQVVLTSTSPANAGVSFEQKLREWQIITQ